MIKKKCVYLLFLIGFIIFLYILINKSILFSNYFDSRYLNLTSNEIQEGIIKKLRSKNIPHKVGKGGYILYRSADEKIVNEIIIEVKREIEDRESSIFFPNKKYRQYFIHLLTEENIPFKYKKKGINDDEYIAWERKYDEKVEKLINRVHEKILK